MNTYEILSILIVPVSIITFTLDYLPDSQIHSNETKIGLLQIVHHIFLNILSYGIVAGVIFPNLAFTVIIVILSIIAQVGYSLNNEYCWYSKMVNKMANTSPNRKWMADFSSFIKHYTRGEDWAYSDIRYINNDQFVCIWNVAIIIMIVRLLIKK